MIKTTLVFAALVLGCALASSGAHAQSVPNPWINGFESGQTGWVVEGGAGIDVNAGYKRSGKNNGWIRGSAGWNALRSSQTVMWSTALSRYICTLSAWVRTSGNVSNFYLTLLNNVTGAIVAEVGPFSGSTPRNGQSLGVWPNYNFLSVTTNILLNQTNDQQWGVRVGFWGNGADAWAQVDDMQLTCNKTAI